ncbi:MAG: DNA recombination/repair protein RecA, partial [bacterium]|nr:DNA recombination/repair protein RecA [bacterium]
QAEFDIIFGKGISRAGGILDLGVESGIITKSGTWFTYGDIRLGQGRENARTFLEEHPDIADEIEARIRSGGVVAVTSSPPLEEIAGAVE